MSSSPTDVGIASVASVTVTDDSLTAELLDGRTITAPLVWFPRLVHGTSGERNNWRPIAGGRGIHWPDLDEDISVDNLLAGQRSGESQQSLQSWLAARAGN